MGEKIEPGGGDKLDVEIIDPNDPEKKSKDKMKYNNLQATRMKVHDAGRNKMWMPEGDKMSIQDLDLILQEILEKAKYWGGGFTMSGGSGGKMKVTKKPVIWGTDEKPSEREARLAVVASHNKRVKQQIARALAKKKVIPFPQKRSGQVEPARKALRAGLELKKELEELISEYGRSKKMTTAREREAYEASRQAAAERNKIRQREIRRQRVLSSIGR